MTTPAHIAVGSATRCSLHVAPRWQRICAHCDSGEVDTVEHFVLNCAAHDRVRAQLVHDLREKLSPGFVAQLGDPSGNPELWLALLLQGELRGIGDEYRMPIKQLADSVKRDSMGRVGVRPDAKQVSVAVRREVQRNALSDRQVGSKIALQGIFDMVKQRKRLAEQQPRRGRRAVDIVLA